MLNELHDLVESLKDASIFTQSWHRHYKTCPKGITYRVLLDKAAEIERIQLLKESAEIASHRKFEVALGQSFPAFNVPPLYWASTEPLRQSLDGVVKRFKAGKIDATMFAQEIRGLILQCTPLWDDEARPRISICLTKVSERLASCVGAVPAGFDAFGELVSRCAKADVKQFGERLLVCALALAASDATLAKDVVRSMLISVEKDRKRIKRPSLILELADQDTFSYPANHAKVQEWVNSRLMASHTIQVSPAAATAPDAFGQSSAGAKESFPSVRLPVLVDVTIRAMSSESPCQYRYGKAESDGFPVGASVRQRMKDALEWIGHPSRRGKTWQDVSDACGYDRGVLFAYPSVLPPIPDEMSEFATLTAGDSTQQARFEAIAEGVVAALRGVVKDHPEAEVRVFALAKADRARTKLLARTSPKASDYIQAAEQWHEGARNLPLIRLHLGGVEPVEPITPFPARLPGDLNILWIRGGCAVDTTEQLTLGDGLRMLLDKDAAAQQTAILHLLALLRNTTPLLLRAGHADHLGLGRRFRDGMDAAAAKAAAESLPRLLGSMGLMLWKLKRRKEDYMNTPCFAVGQLLSLADLLHREYCRNVRQGDVPNQLIGNAMMPIALENPERAVARMNERLMVYQRWAFTSDGSVAATRLGKWTLKRLGIVTAELASRPLPSRADDADKAQLLLGYLARQEQEETSN